MPYPTTDEFQKHAENHSAVSKSLTQVERLHKAAIRRNSGPEVDTLGRLYYLTIGIWAETSLRKIVSEPTGFNENEVGIIWSERSKIDQWKKAVDLAFRRHYQVLLHLPLDPSTLGPRSADQQQVADLLEHDLRPVIEGRNRVAHGQWIHHLKSRSETDFVSGGPHGSAQNYWDSWCQKRLLSGISELVLALAVSRPAFERDFPAIMTGIREAKADLTSNLNGSRMEAYACGLKKTAAKPPAG